jgi:predicted amidohydrolase YtcJ
MADGRRSRRVSFASFLCDLRSAICQLFLKEPFMKHALPAFVFSFLSLAAIAAEPSLVIVNGKVWTGDPSKPAAEAVAIDGNQIVAVGSNAEIRAMVADPKKTRIVDAGGRRVIPGINDAHTHPPSGMTGFALNTEFDAPWSAIASAIAATLDETPADLWLLGTLGPSAVNDKSITRDAIDKVAKGRMVILTGFTGHVMVLSTAAMKALNVAPDAKDPNGGWYERDASGNLNGRVYEYAEYAIDRRFADMASDDELLGAIRSYSDEAISYGITSVQAMTTTSEQRYAHAVTQAHVPLRIRVMSFPSSDTNVWKGANALKWILDGTPIERNAALRTTKYADGSQGRENFKDITPLVQMAVANKQQLLLHAAGDKTVADALNAISKTSLQRARIEHADGLQSDLVPLAKRTGVIAVLNPTHFPFRGAYPKGEYMAAASLVKAGIPIAIGSDGPMNPYLNIGIASARPDQPLESLSREEALRAYTSGSAFAEMMETKKGKIAPGMLADIAVLSQDILDPAVRSLEDTRAAMTIIDGKVVYEQ